MNVGARIRIFPFMDRSSQYPVTVLRIERTQNIVLMSSDRRLCNTNPIIRVPLCFVMLKVLMTIDRFLDFLGSDIMNQPETLFSSYTLQIYLTLKTLTKEERSILHDVVDDAWDYLIGSVFTNSCRGNKNVENWLGLLLISFHTTTKDLVMLGYPDFSPSSL